MGIRSRSAVLAVAVAVVGSGCASSPSSLSKNSSSSSSSSPEFFPDARGLPFSDSVRVGDLLILSGEIGTLPGTTTLAPGGIEAEARQTMKNVEAKLARRGASLDDVVK